MLFRLILLRPSLHYSIFTWQFKPFAAAIRCQSGRKLIHVVRPFLLSNPAKEISKTFANLNNKINHSQSITALTRCTLCTVSNPRQYTNFTPNDSGKSGTFPQGNRSVQIKLVPPERHRVCAKCWPKRSACKRGCIDVLTALTFSLSSLLVTDSAGVSRCTRRMLPGLMGINHFY